MSSILQHAIRLLAVAERQILGSRSGRSISLPAPDSICAWCHQCGAPRLGVFESENYFERLGCRKCYGVCLARDRTIRLGTYDNRWREAILAVKHGGDRALARELGTLLARQWQQTIVAHSFIADSAVVIPIPMPLARRVERGIDHAREIAVGVSKALGISMARCLEHDAGPVQAMLTRADRQSRAQRIRWKSASKWEFDARLASDRQAFETIFLVDDVLTTGSTAAQACAAIRSRLGAPQIVMLVVATT